MSAEQIEFLTEYDEWKAVKKVQRDDLSPEAFLIDRAKDQALQKLITIAEHLEVFNNTEFQTDAAYVEGAEHLIGNIAGVIES